MQFHFANLDDKTRHYMMTEIDLDVSSGKLYISSRLNDAGVQQYESLLNP